MKIDRRKDKTILLDISPDEEHILIETGFIFLLEKGMEKFDEQTTVEMTNTENTNTGIDVLDIIEQDDGSAIVSVDITEEERDFLMEVGLTRLLDKEIESKLKEFNKD